MRRSTIVLGGIGLLAVRALLGRAQTARDSGAEPALAHEVVERVVARVRARAGRLTDDLRIWPVPPEAVMSLGDNVGDRGGKHMGLDIHVPAGTQVRAPEALRIVQVKDGTKAAPNTPTWKAGMFVDAEGAGGRVVRFQHLAAGSVQVSEGDQLQPGEPIGAVTHKGDAGLLNSEPHLHFEVRRPATGPGYGAPLNPADVLPLAGSAEVRRQLARKRSRTEELA